MQKAALVTLPAAEQEIKIVAPVALDGSLLPLGLTVACRRLRQSRYREQNYHSTRN
jgi:hypothetical protein